MPEYETTNKSFYLGYPINTGYRNQFQCYTLTLDYIIDRLEYMTRQHSKVMCCRVDIHLPSYMRADICKLTTRILESLSRTLKVQAIERDKKNKFEMHYVWCSERNTSENEHVHCLLLFNGHTNASGYHVWEEVKKIVKRIFSTDNDGLVQRGEFEYRDEHNRKIKRNELMIDRCSYYYEDRLALAIYAASYLAKTTYAHNRVEGRRIAHASRLPRI